MLHAIEIEDVEWLDFVGNSADATVFHHPYWSKLLVECYGYKSFVFVLRDKTGRISAGLPVMEISSWLTGKRWITLPFTDHCCPLSRNDDALELLISRLIQKSKEFKNLKFEIRYKLPSAKISINKRSFYIHYLDLEKPPEELYKSFRKKGVQYCLKKAKKTGIRVIKSEEYKSLKEFYDLHLKTRKKLGVPTQPVKYFKKLWEHVLKQGMGYIMLAYYEDKAVAGGVFLHNYRKLIYKYGATDPDYMNTYANHALLWESIQWGCKNGFKVFDWGKTEKNHQGLRHFKLGWGTEEKELVYSYIGMVPKNYSSGVKQKIVEKSIQKLPSWFGRIVGELLYKHVG